jgi:hypothetical protein
MANTAGVVTNTVALQILSQQDFSLQINCLWPTFKDKTGVGPSDNVVQLIKAHILHILFVVSEKDQDFQKICATISIPKSRFFSETANNMCKMCALMS